MTKIKKEVVLTLNLHGLTEEEKIEKETFIANAHVDNPTYVPTLNPTAADVLSQIGTQTTLFAKRDNLKKQLKTVTEAIHEGDESLNDIFVNQWRPQTQTAIAGDVKKAKALGYGVKGQDTGHTSVAATTAKEIILNYFPDISRIDVNVHDQHTIHIKDNLTGKRRLPPGVLRADVYGFTGDAGLAIADLSALIALGGGYLGQAAKGKFINTFDSSSTGKTEYYVVVYVSKKTKKPVAQSKVVSAIIN